MGAAHWQKPKESQRLGVLGDNAIEVGFFIYFFKVYFILGYS